jgi:mono/diheme cytochrome c family protein
MTPKFGKVFGLGCAVLIGGLFASLALNSATGSPGGSAEDTYGHKCAVCHGKDGAGQTAKGKKLKVVDVRETIKKYSEDEMIKIATDGKGKDMDGFKKELSQDEIKAIVEYYRGLAKQ